jgi:hypothetical protein
MNGKYLKKLRNHAWQHGLKLLQVSRLDNFRDYEDAKTCVCLLADAIERDNAEFATDWDATADIVVSVRRVR